MKPNFLVIGASKCGTSSLCELLGQHPDVFMSKPKEPNFFCYDQVYARGWEWYETLFAGAESKRAVGEGTAQYAQRTVWPDCLGRIARDLPEARLIYIVRHPLRRMESLWIHSLENRRALPHDFNEALRLAPKKMIDSSNYLQEIDAFRRHFPDERILVTFFEDLRDDARGLLRRCYEFLGVDPAFTPSDAERARNVSAIKRVEAPWLKRLRLSPIYPHISGLLPRRIKRSIRERSRVPAPPRPHWSRATLNWVLEQVEADSRAFLERYGKPADFWNMREIAVEA